MIMIRIAAAFVALAQVLCEPLPFETTFAGCCEHLVSPGYVLLTNPAFSEKLMFCSKFLLDLINACLVSVSSTVNGSTAPWSHLSFEVLSTSGGLIKSLLAYCVAAC